MHRAVCVDMPSVSGIQVVSFVLIASAFCCAVRLFCAMVVSDLLAWNVRIDN